MLKKLLFIILFFILIVVTLLWLSWNNFPNFIFNKNISLRVAKWYNDFPATLTISYDEGWPISDKNKIAQELILKYDLSMDYEIVTESYNNNRILLSYLKNKLITKGFGYFGHGHQHICHDDLTYEEAYESFKNCYDYMLSYGLKPIAYAYPAGCGFKDSTVNALKKAGFLSGRMHRRRSTSSKHITPYDQMEPTDWFRLPTVVMQDYDFEQIKECCNNNEELILILDEALDIKSWIILTYHAIGSDKERNWGFYKLDEFEKDLQSISARNFWIGSINDVTLYMYERNKITIEKKIYGNFLTKNIKKIKLILEDGLDNQIFDHPLTILMEFPDKWINKKIYVSQDHKLEYSFVLKQKTHQLNLLPNEKPYFFSIADVVFQ